ncbi:formin-binding protein 4-like [Mercenaria mercenaria]|uniref:formin-binding protein 4-like n=1 Tax=Mercenaria mercenaria TaxID=6596 RepID=UPI00234E37FA|nr:formin-binding protein 4-like [Mercenaria mercenaria]
MKPPPPTDEMIAYEEERRSQVVDYGHGRSSSRLYDMNGDSDTEEMRSADAREMEMKKLESLQLAELALSKLEFLEVTKKGLSKLQILLIELETRHQDWQAGGLTTNHFLGKLREANWQLEQYEASAAPTGWACSWDRDYRRYFYTHKLTGKNQWDYPDADDIRVEDEKAQDPKKKLVRGKEVDSEITSTSDKGKGRSMEKDILASMALPPPPPPPAEEHPSVKSLQLMYGSSSDSETEEPSSKKVKKEAEPSDLNSVPLPPEEPHKEKEKKDKHHKKKKKKEKSKKKEKDKSEAGVMGPAGPVGPSYPQLAAQPPPPPPGEAPGNTIADPYVTTGVESYPTTAVSEQQTPMEVPVYGTMDDDHAGLNDQPLEFGAVQESSGPHPYAEGTEMGESGVISHGPQMATVSHQPETYNTYSTDPSGSGEPVSEAVMGEGYAESSMGAVPNMEEKKKKKKEKMGAGSISLKKKHVSSMVQKWQKVKKEVELEEQHRQIREAEIRRKLAELE